MKPFASVIRSKGKREKKKKNKKKKIKGYHSQSRIQTILKRNTERGGKSPITKYDLGKI